MGYIVLTLEFIAFMRALYLFKSSGVLGNSNEIWWFLIPAITAQCISMAVKIVQMTVGPTTWKKLEEHANMAMFVASTFEMIALHQVGLMAFSDSYWIKFILNLSCIGIIGVTCVIVIQGVVKGGK